MATRDETMRIVQAEFPILFKGSSGFALRFGPEGEAGESTFAVAGSNPVVLLIIRCREAKPFYCFFRAMGASRHPANPQMAPSGAFFVERKEENKGWKDIATSDSRI